MNSEAPDAEFLAEVERRAEDWVRQAGEKALLEFWQPLDVEFKQSNKSDPVTQADRESETFLRNSILAAYPDHAILGEEGTEVETGERDYIWVLDPVDGTTNFVNGLPLFACSAALLYRCRPVVGAIFLPVAPRVSGPGRNGQEPRGPRPWSRVLHAREGGGTSLDEEPVRVSTAASPEPSSLAGLPGYYSHQFFRLGRLSRESGEPRNLGSICMETAMVAGGVFRYAVFRSPKIWDVAAGVLIVREAGGEALAWRQGRWNPLTCFEPMEDSSKPGDRRLRHWRSPVLVGGSDVTGFVGERLRPRVGFRRRMGHLLRRLGLRRPRRR